MSYANTTFIFKWCFSINRHSLHRHSLLLPHCIVLSIHHQNCTELFPYTSKFALWISSAVVDASVPFNLGMSVVSIRFYIILTCLFYVQSTECWQSLQKQLCKKQVLCDVLNLVRFFYFCTVGWFNISLHFLDINLIGQIRSDCQD